MRAYIKSSPDNVDGETKQKLLMAMSSPMTMTMTLAHEQQHAMSISDKQPGHMQNASHTYMDWSVCVCVCRI